MADSLLGKAKEARGLLQRSPGYDATTEDGELYICELNTEFLIAKLRSDAVGVRAALQQLRAVVGVTPAHLWTKAFVLNGAQQAYLPCSQSARPIPLQNVSA
jgi:hypothetical protein